MGDLVRYRKQVLASAAPARTQLEVRSERPDEVTYVLKLPSLAPTAVDELHYLFHMHDWIDDGADLVHDAFYPEYGWFLPGHLQDELQMSGYRTSDSSSSSDALKVQGNYARAGTLVGAGVLWLIFGIIFAFYPGFFLEAYVFASIVGLISYVLFFHDGGLVARLRARLKRAPARARLRIATDQQNPRLELKLKGRERDEQTARLLVRELDQWIASQE